MGEDRLQESIGYVLARAGKAHRGRVATALAELGLHVGQELVLVQLWAEEGLTQSELAERLGVEPPTVTKMLGRMEKAGLVERESDPDDARISRVYPTERGRALEQPVREAWEEIEEDMLAGFTLEERILLRRLLLQVRSNL